jgi:hypothetical protein
MTRGLLFANLVLGLAACRLEHPPASSQPPPTSVPAGRTPDPQSPPFLSPADARVQPTPHLGPAQPESRLCAGSTNPIDLALCDRFVVSGCSMLRPASNEELCRRIAVDFAGALPTPEEYAARCAGKTPGEMVDAYLTTPEYLRHEQAHWAQRLRWDPARVYAAYLVDADRLLLRLASGQDGYDVFARKIMAHPAFAIGSRLPYAEADSTADQVDKVTQTAQNAFRVFLGESAIAGQDVELGKLFLPWTKTYFDTGAGNGLGGWYADLDPGRCVGPLGTNACSATLFGRTVSIGLPLAQITRYDTFAGNVPADIEAELEKPGDLIASERAFWDEAVDHALLRLTGYWKTTRAEPDTDVPEVRAAATAAFRALPDHDYRALLKMIATSVLYTSTSMVDPAAVNDPPIFCTGPLKPMMPEDYVVSMGKVVGKNTGRCDYHTAEAPGGGYFFPDSLRSDIPGDSDLGMSFHYNAASAMRGCRGGTPPPLEPGLGLVFGAVGVAQTLCSASTALTPAGFNLADTSDANIRALIDYQFARDLERAPDDSERAGFAASAAACLADPQCGMAQLPGHFCEAILRSEALLYY